MKRFAAIDLGSNALRMQIVEASWTPPSRKNAFGTWAAVGRCRSAVRLGQDAFARGRLASETMDAACDALREFRREMAAARVDSYRAVATSALREAENGSSLVARAERTTGIQVEIIGGVEEAELVAQAIRRRLPLIGGHVVLFDLGGGSAEVTLLEDGWVRSTRSLPLGTVRLLQCPEFTREGRLEGVGQSSLNDHIDRVLLPALVPVQGSPCRVIATGGNAKALAQICPVKDGPSGRIDTRKMNELLVSLARLSVAERTASASLRVDRADVIVPAAAVLLRLARHLNVSSLIAPRIGLRDGVLDALIAEGSARRTRSSVADIARNSPRAGASGGRAAPAPC